MTDVDLASLKLAVQLATRDSDPCTELPTSLAARLVAGLEGRTISHRRLLDAAVPVIAAVGKWRASEIDAATAMQVISGAVDAWEGGKA